MTLCKNAHVVTTSVNLKSLNTYQLLPIFITYKNAITNSRYVQSATYLTNLITYNNTWNIMFIWIISMLNKFIYNNRLIFNILRRNKRLETGIKKKENKRKGKVIKMKKRRKKKRKGLIFIKWKRKKNWRNKRRSLNQRIKNKVVMSGLRIVNMGIIERMMDKGKIIIKS